MSSDHPAPASPTDERKTPEPAREFFEDRPPVASRTARPSPQQLLLNTAKDQGDPIPTHKVPDSRMGCVLTVSTLSKAVIRHPYFERLSKILQLGQVIFSNKHASHTRAEHSISVGHYARVLALTIQKQIPRVTNRMVLMVELAGLCHDLGHGPFSHVFDEVLLKAGIPAQYAHHEHRSQILFQKIIEDLQIREKSATENFEVVSGISALSDTDIRMVQFFIDPRRYWDYLATPHDDPIRALHASDPDIMGALGRVVSSPDSIDVDKMDYLTRDPEGIGMGPRMAPIDVDGILQRCHIGPDGRLEYSLGYKSTID
jgi:HD superfamily phosphohydrolase